MAHSSSCSQTKRKLEWRSIEARPGLASPGEEESLPRPGSSSSALIPSPQELQLLALLGVSRRDGALGAGRFPSQLRRRGSHWKKRGQAGRSRASPATGSPGQLYYTDLRPSSEPAQQRATDPLGAALARSVNNKPAPEPDPPRLAPPHSSFHRRPRAVTQSSRRAGGVTDRCLPHFLPGQGAAISRASRGRRQSSEMNGCGERHFLMCVCVFVLCFLNC